MDHGIHDTCNREDASYYSTDVNQELDEGFSILREHDSDGREFVVEHEKVLTCTIVSLVVGCQLVYIVLSV